LAAAAHSLNLVKHSLGVFPSTRSEILIHLSFVAIVDATVFIPYSIYDYYSFDQAFASAGAATWGVAGAFFVVFFKAFYLLDSISSAASLFALAWASFL
jgi:hypothetical protein